MIESAICVVYSDYSFFDSCLSSIDGKIKTIFFLVPYTRWNGETDEDGNNKVLEIIKKYQEKNPEWILIRRHFKKQSEARNYALWMAESNGYKYSMIIDSDEIWDDENLNKLENLINTTNFSVYACQMHTYFKSVKWRINPPQKLRPLVAVRTHVRFDYTRHPISKNSFTSTDIFMHHPSHVRTDDEMKIKLECCQSCTDRVLLFKWFENVWKKWTPDTKNFHPTKPESFKEVLEMNKEDIPQSLWKYIGE